jgi:N-acetylglucosamine-6-sulfatase
MARLLLLVAAVLAAAAPAAGAPARPRPNFVVIMTDDQAFTDMAAMPQTRRLIGDAGATFTRAYVSYPLCCPSRATFLTGRYAHNHGVRTNSPPEGGVEALDATHTLPVWLNAAGYATSHVGKYLNGYGLRRRAAVPPGWTDWHATVDKSTYQMYGYTLNENGGLRTYGAFEDEDPAAYQTDVLRDRALEAIAAHARRPEPLFLSVAFLAPHGEVTEPGGRTEPHVRPAARHLGRLAGSPLPRDAARALAHFGPATRERLLTDFEARRESLLAVDEAVGAVVAALQATGELDSTYLLFTSDNGFFQGERGIAKGKYLPYTPATHVPLMLRGPGIAPGTVSRELVVNTDLAPTALEAAGAAPDRPVDGRSLLPFARDGGLRSDRPVLHEGLVAGDADRDGAPRRRARRLGVYYAVRTSRFLYVMWKGGRRELYDLTLDPGERRSVHADPRYGAVKAFLTAALRRLRRCAGDACLAPFPILEPQPERRRARDVARTRPAASRARTAT